MTCAALVAAICAAVPGAAAAATDGQIVAIERAGTSETLVTYNAPSMTARRALHSAADLSAPQWSPDGNRIVFAEGATVKLYDLASGRVSDVAAGTAPTWTHDGAGVTFVRGSQVLTRTLAGAETVLEGADGTGVGELAWDPSGDALALWVTDRIDAWTPAAAAQTPALTDAAGGLALRGTDAPILPRRVDASTISLFRLGEGVAGDVRLTQEAGAADTDPDISPSGRVIFTRTVAGRSQLALLLDDGGLNRFGDGLSEPDWQPCVEGVTVSCTSPLLGAVPTCRLRTSMVPTVRPGGTLAVPFSCVGARSVELVEPPAHGTVTITSARRVSYRAAAGYQGPDTFTLRGVRGTQASAPLRVTVNVAPRPPKPAAPKLTLVPGRLKLDKRGRVTVRGTCDRACTVRLRVRVKLTSGRVLVGRVVRAKAAAGGTVTLRLRRPKLPPRRKVAWARVSGEVIGADQRTRAVKLKLG